MVLKPLCSSGFKRACRRPAIGPLLALCHPQILSTIIFLAFSDTSFSENFFLDPVPGGSTDSVFLQFFIYQR